MVEQLIYTMLADLKVWVSEKKSKTENKAGHITTNCPAL